MYLIKMQDIKIGQMYKSLRLGTHSSILQVALLLMHVLERMTYVIL